MRKLPTLFVRDPDDRAHVLPVVTSGCEWVLAGAGVPTRKWDGTAFQLDTRGRWWARRELKPGQASPPDYRTEQYDPNTGKTVGWEPAERSPFRAFHGEAVRALTHVARPGTFELVGPKVNGNPEQYGRHVLLRHGDTVLTDLRGASWSVPEAAYDSLRHYLVLHPAHPGMEGIVWHHPDGSMVKLKAKDFAVAPSAPRPVPDLATAVATQLRVSA